MIAVRVSPDIRFAEVATSSYFLPHPLPKKPQDLSAHRCINYRLTTSGGLYAWECEKRGKAVGGG